MLDWVGLFGLVLVGLVCLEWVGLGVGWFGLAWCFSYSLLKCVVLGLIS